MAGHHDGDSLSEENSLAQHGKQHDVSSTVLATVLDVNVNSSDFMDGVTMDSGVFALMPTRRAFELASNPGAAYLTAAGVTVKLLPNFSSVFAAYTHGVEWLHPADNDIVMLVHDDVALDMPTADFVRLLRRQLNRPGVGFVGTAGARTLSRELVWWRSGASGGAPGTPSGLAHGLAGMVHHGLDVAERSFFGPWGRTVVLDGVLLAATGRTLRSIRLSAPVGLDGFHFYDISYTLQAHAAGLANIALPFGLRHESNGVTGAVYESARARLATRLHSLLPLAVPTVGAPRPHRRVALLLDEEGRGSASLADNLRRAGYEVFPLSTLRHEVAEVASAAAEPLERFHVAVHEVVEHREVGFGLVGLVGLPLQFLRVLEELGRGGESQASRPRLRILRV